MATLVLTTVGTAVGGPLGGALGGLVGQSIDRALFRPAGRREGPRLSDLKVQVSSYGVPIAKVFGTMRVAGCVIWSTDLIETRTTSRAGKGQPGTTSYTYSASFAVALSARPVTGVGRIWADGKLLRGAAGDWKASTTFRLHPGSEDQVADPLIAALTPDAPAHRGLAYAVFEGLQLADFGNRIPSLTFELFADAAPLPAADLLHVLTGGIVARDGTGATIAGMAATGDSMVGAIAAVQTMLASPPVTDGAGMRLARGDIAPIMLGDDIDMREERRTVDRVPRTVALSYYDPERDYQVGVQRARRAEGAGWRDETIDLPVALPATRALDLAGAALRRAEQARVTRTVTLDADRLAIGPGAIVQLRDGTQWRVTHALLEGMRLKLDLVAIGETFVGGAADPGRAVLAPDVALGRTVLIAAELPPLDDAPVAMWRIAVLAAGTAPGWRGAGLLASMDGGATWEAAGSTAAPATLGVLANAVDARPGTLVDRVSRVEVELAHAAMTLASVDDGLLDRGGNLALIGNEIVQFRDAEQIAPRRWRLRTLLRGRRGTRVAVHAAGTRFALLDREAIRWLDVPAARPGTEVRLLASSAGDAAEPAATSLLLDGASVAPPAPVHLRHRALADGGVGLDWIRRSRLGWRWEDGGDVPLGEEAEAYLVTITTSGAERVLTISRPGVALPAAGPGDAPVRVTVRQQGTLAASRAALLSL